MGISVCPATTVAAPAANVWELLADPARYDLWWDARAERIVPEGPATPGQIVYAKTREFGRTWNLTLTVRAVEPEKRRIQIDALLPFGTINHATITATTIDATSCRLAFG